ncbi:hypothetical protein CEE36_00540 [candidate division TA06 bacterium B3_TA06]|uniref:Uncharacterized protein n=1 Tax=candidate division TA06 bacterium B3_TA06 TaxID=2012487 RepID=A0A532VAU7_UNCT6|nr:MAG: hypothetical protein CEE36_00540 [candidate division TA06 bacterium B3_TA06]
MSDEATTCPKCGSDELVDWGTNLRMCRRCHEVFLLTQEEIEDKEESLQTASERAERFLESLRADREKAKKGYETEKELTSVSDEELEKRLETPSEPSTQTETLQEVTVEPEASATHEFEEFYANLKVEQARQAETHAAKPEIQVQKKKSSARKAIVWVVVAVLIWLVLVIICSLR